MQDHQELETLALTYALSSLDTLERQLFEAHLTSCDICHRIVAETRYLADALALAAEERNPPPHLRERVLTAARSGPSSVPVRQGPHSAPTRRLWRLLAHPISVAAMFGLLGLSVASLTLWNLRLQDRVQIQETRLAKTYQAIAIMGQAESWWSVRGAEAAPEATGTLAYAEQQDASCLLLWNLPKVQGKSYEAWTWKEGAITKVGTMRPMDSGRWIIIPGALEQADRIVVTLEEAGGSLQPQGPVVVDISLGLTQPQ